MSATELKRFRVSGTADYRWEIYVDAESEQAARNEAEIRVNYGQVQYERFSYISIESCEEVSPVFDENQQRGAEKRL